MFFILPTDRFRRCVKCRLKSGPLGWCHLRWPTFNFSSCRDGIFECIDWDLTGAVGTLSPASVVAAGRGRWSCVAACVSQRPLMVRIGSSSGALSWCLTVGEGESTSLTLGTRQLSFLQTDAQAYLPSDNLKHLGNIAVCSLGSGASEPEAPGDCCGGQGAV